VDVVGIQHEPETRHFQVSQVLLEAIADELVQTGDVVVVVYSAFEKDNCDTVTVVRPGRAVIATDIARFAASGNQGAAGDAADCGGSGV
jgi:hypothetical protein